MEDFTFKLLTGVLLLVAGTAIYVLGGEYGQWGIAPALIGVVLVVKAWS